MDYILTLDSNITQFIHSVLPQNNLVSPIFSFFSYVGSTWIWWVIVLFLILLYEEHRNHKFMLYFSIAFGTTYIMNEFILKNVFMRHRPWFSSLACPLDYSFPSTHAATSFAAASILAYYDPKRRFIYYLIAVFISYSRIYLGCHYLGDVLFGGLLGALIAHLTLKLPLSYRKRRNHVHKK